MQFQGLHVYIHIRFYRFLGFPNFDFFSGIYLCYNMAGEVKLNLTAFSFGIEG